jgi:hypothetical protein
MVEMNLENKVGKNKERFALKRTFEDTKKGKQSNILSRYGIK